MMANIRSLIDIITVKLSNFYIYMCLITAFPMRAETPVINLLPLFTENLLSVLSVI